MRQGQKCTVGFIFEFGIFEWVFILRLISVTPYKIKLFLPLNLHRHETEQLLQMALHLSLPLN
jgi:hypothetical protein